MKIEKRRNSIKYLTNIKCDYHIRHGVCSKSKSETYIYDHDISYNRWLLVAKNQMPKIKVEIYFKSSVLLSFYS